MKLDFPRYCKILWLLHIIITSGCLAGVKSPLQRVQTTTTTTNSTVGYPEAWVTDREVLTPLPSRLSLKLKSESFCEIAIEISTNLGEYASASLWSPDRRFLLVLGLPLARAGIPPNKALLVVLHSATCSADTHMINLNSDFYPSVDWHLDDNEFALTTHTNQIYVIDAYSGEIHRSIKLNVHPNSRIDGIVKWDRMGIVYRVQDKIPPFRTKSCNESGECVATP